MVYDYDYDYGYAPVHRTRRVHYYAPAYYGRTYYAPARYGYSWVPRAGLAKRRTRLA